MPSTINGIGTSYVGKSNLTQREGQCHSCNRHAFLISYDTRLCFVVFFIPVIPLGRKRIVDQCSICTRHYSMGADQYQKVSTESIDEGMKQFKNDPSAETALGVHGRLIAFQKFDEAKEFREKALQFFGNDAEFMTEMAAQLDEMNRNEELIPLLDRILVADPSNKMIRARQAVLLSQRGEIDRARPLLDYLEKPGAFVDSSPAPLVHLAEMFSKQGRHDEALKMLEHMLRELPRLGKEPAFRRMVLGIEKKAGRTSSLVPSPKNSLFGWLNPLNDDIDPARRKAGWIAAGVVALLALLVGVNYFISQHRQLHIVNGFKKDLSVSIDGAPAVLVPPGRADVPIREGKHKAKVTGVIDEDFDFEVKAGYFERFFRKPAWVLVPGKGAVLRKLNIVYSQKGDPGSAEPLFGERLHYVPHCDYPFVDTPATLPVSENGSVTKVALETVPGLSVEQVAAFISAKDPDASMSYLEKHLADDPSNESLGYSYAYFGSQLKLEKRVARYLQDGLDKRPIIVGWHRIWSTLLKALGRQDEVLAYYDKALATEGKSAPLLYLHARVDTDDKRSVESIAAARQLDPNFGWLWYIDGVGFISKGDFAAAKDQLQQAIKLGVPESTIGDQFLLARLGIGEGPQLVTELQKELQQDMTNPEHIEFLTIALIANGSPNIAREEFEKWAQQTRVRTALSNQYLNRMRERLMYRLRDLPQFENAMKQSGRDGAGDDPFRSEYLMVVGRLKEAELQDPNDLMGRADMFGLKMALAFHLQGDLERSKAWAEKVADTWSTQAGYERKGAEFLRSAEAPPYDEFAATRISFIEKALLAALIARRFPNESKPFADHARKLMLSRNVGSLLIAKALDSP